MRLSISGILATAGVLAGGAGWLSLAPSPASRVNATAPQGWTGAELDGVYFFDARNAHRVLEIRGPTARWGRGGTTEFGAMEHTDRRLKISYANQVEAMSYAVIDGELWVGVMQRDPSNPTRWSSQTTGCKQAARCMLEIDSDLSWDEETGRFTVSVNGALPTVSHVALPLDSLEMSIEGRPYRRSGDSVITPWSKSLGKVGLISNPELARSVRGTWQAEGADPSDTVQLVGEYVPYPASASGSPEPKRITLMPGAGVDVVDWGPRCGQVEPHTQSTTVFVLLAEDRVLQLVRPGAHAASQAPTRRILHRVAEAGR